MDICRAARNKFLVIACLLVTGPALATLPPPPGVKKGSEWSFPPDAPKAAERIPCCPAKIARLRKFEPTALNNKAG